MLNSEMCKWLHSIIYIFNGKWSCILYSALTFYMLYKVLLHFLFSHSHKPTLTAALLLYTLYTATLLISTLTPWWAHWKAVPDSVPFWRTLKYVMGLEIDPCILWLDDRILPTLFYTACIFFMPFFFLCIVTPFSKVKLLCTLNTQN